MTRLRVARVITRLNVGGPSIQAMLLTRELLAQGWETWLIAGVPGRAEGDMMRLRPVEGVRPIVVPSLVREISPFHDARSLVRLTVLLRQIRPDVVHTHLAKAGLLGRLAARLAGVPIVVHTYHGNVLRGYFGPAGSRVFLELERAIARVTTRLISISPRQTREILSLRIADAERITEVPLGLELGPFARAEKGWLRAELEVGESVPLIGTVGRLVPVKGMDVFLRVAAQVARSCRDAMFVVVGDGELAADLRSSAAALGLAGRLRFLGWRADLPNIYADLDVVVQTSHNEGTPVSLIEALAGGRAVVATAVGGVPDLIQHGRSGLLTADGDVDGLARAIMQLLRDDAFRSALGIAGRERVYPQHELATLVGRVVALYLDLASQRSRPHR